MQIAWLGNKQQISVLQVIACSVQISMLYVSDWTGQLSTLCKSLFGLCELPTYPHGRPALYLLDHRVHLCCFSQSPSEGASSVMATTTFSVRMVIRPTHTDVEGYFHQEWIPGKSTTWFTILTVLHGVARYHMSAAGITQRCHLYY